MREITDQTEEALRPEACPFCQSKALSTLAKVISASTYWRCATCGNVWNPSRLAKASRLPRSRSW
jgi:ribosomal protein L37AE/L43A